MEQQGLLSASLVEDLVEDWLIEFVKMKGLINKKSDRLIRKKKFRCEAPLGWNYVIGYLFSACQAARMGFSGRLDFLIFLVDIFRCRSEQEQDVRDR